MKVDLLIKNGRVIDPANGVDEIKDIAIRDGKIVELEGEPEFSLLSGSVDASGCIVSPGLIDFHTHIHSGAAASCVPVDMLASWGVTGAVDAGTAGTSNFEAFYRDIVAHAVLRVKSYLAPHSLGQCGRAYKATYDPTQYDMGKMEYLFERYPDQILGLKMQDSIGMVEPDVADEYLAALVKIARSFGSHVCVHMTNPPTSAENIADLMGEGDIYCHCYQGKGSTIIGDNGKVKPQIRAARERGVIFDAANGLNNYGIECCRAALDDGFLPDIISTDATSMGSNKPYKFKSLPNVMSKYLTLGMPMMEVIRAVTQTPAKVMGMSEHIGSLSVGSWADVTIMKEKKVRVTYNDTVGGSLEGDIVLVPQMTVIGGAIMFCQTDFFLENA